MFTWQQQGGFGGHLFLDFVNTVDDDDKTRAVNAIPDWKTCLEWAVAFDALSEAEAARLAADAEDEEIGRELAALFAFRECAWRGLSRVALDDNADAADLDALAATAAWALPLCGLVQDGRSLRWSAMADRFGSKLIRARLALALMDLMAREDLGRLRECDRCAGLFLDHGRGAGRRWCRMSACGNRAKAERFRSKD